MEEHKQLTMSFDPNTIQHLGIKMYSTLPAALAELVANGYDADANNVIIKINNTTEDKQITVEDDGCGMSFDEINNFFLRIGRNRRNEDMRMTPQGRIATGKKGLGKLALFGIGETIKVITHKLNEKQEIEFTLKWNDILNCTDTSYHPQIIFRDVTDQGKKYTRITILNLKRKTDISINELAVSLAKMFNFLDCNFNVSLQLNNDTPLQIDNKKKFEDVNEQFHWEYPNDFSEYVRSLSYAHKNQICGKIITSEKPLKTNLRGISLFANGRLVNMPEFFGIPTSSHFFSYTTGWLNVDFIDDDNTVGDDDLISTNRQSLDWERPETVELKEYLKKLLDFVQKEWRSKRTENNKKPLKQEGKIDREKWLGTIPKDKAESIEHSIAQMADPDSEEEPVSILENALHAIAPEYAELHWRYLDKAITDSDVVQRLYEQENYFQAASEAVKTYISKVKQLSRITTQMDRSLMMLAFGRNEPTKIYPISLTHRTDDIENDIEEGQRYYSAGLVTGFKNPVVSHSTEEELVSRGLFCEKDCLDILSLLSHLFSRLDKRVDPPK